MYSTILFDNKQIMGEFHYKNYNCSIIKLDKNETSTITNKKYNIESILIIFFVSSLNKRYGTMSWVGIINYNNLIQLLTTKTLSDKKKFWIIKPHLLQNDKGPKCADLRIFKTHHNICVIGYTRLAPKSNTINISDYYVRASIIDTRINNELYYHTKDLYHFNEIDGGCFPSKINNNYKKFQIKDDYKYIDNIEFYITNNITSNLVSPHKSKHPNMPNKIKLNGIEVSFSTKSSNEDCKTHISTKNIIPLQHKKLLNNVGAFIDLTPPNSNKPLLTLQNLNSAKVLLTHTININNNFKSKTYRGSTPFIELNNNKWITISHKRLNNQHYKYNIEYKYYFVLYDSKTFNINNQQINLPNNCIQEIEFDISNHFKTDFIYITGLIVHKQIENNLDLLISYGISDSKSGISFFKLKINN